jgi:lactate dehydrogenase-like 2-hydroxyacid dehydrogenase
MLIIYGGTHNSVNRSAEKMSLTILYPDAQFAGDPDVEREVFGMDTVLHIFRARLVGEIPAELWSRCDAILCFDIEIGAKTIANAARCRQIVRAGVGFDNIDIAAAAARSIPVCNTPDYGTTDVADHAIGMMLALTRGIVAYNDGAQTRGRGRMGFYACAYCTTHNRLRVWRDWSGPNRHGSSIARKGAGNERHLL